MKISTLAFFLIMLLTSCVQQGESSTEKPVVTVTVLPQKYFIKELAGDKVIVNVLVPPGASPATYEPSVSQLSQLDKSALYMKMGYLGFELSWMDKIRSVNPEMEVIDLSEGVELIFSREEEGHEGHGHTHAGTDPHIWMSARNAKIIVGNMAKVLKDLLPGEAVQIADRHSALLNRLDSLDREIGNLLAEAEGRSFMIYHPSLSYYARDYGLKQLSLEWEGKSPSPSHMKELTDQGREHQISSILIQLEFDRKNAQVLASEIGAEIVVINPLDEAWPVQMMFIATKLEEQW